MDGNYSSHLDLRLLRAETVVWLDLPRSIYFPRAVRRSIRNYGRQRSDLGRGCPEKLELAFFKNWVWAYPTRSRIHHAEFLAHLPDGIHGIILRSRHDVAKLANDLPRSLATGATTKALGLAVPATCWLAPTR
jgi:adenylate kinase family enzyme